VLGLAVLAAAFCGAVLLLKSLDSVIATEPATRGFYSKLKAGVAERWDAVTGGARSETEQRLHRLLPQHSAPVAAPLPGSEEQNDQRAPSSRNSRGRTARSERPEHVRLLPYITAGLTKAEVIAFQGAPTLATEDRLVYGGTEFYFRDDKLNGWKIDSRSAPVLVRLWPDAPVDPALQYFSVGSSKNEVIALQGTPTLFSENTFGYGGSEVFFRNNRVVGWKADPASTPLRAASR
jgi:hypothetical protein